MSYEILSRQFNEILDRYSGTDRDRRAMLRELRLVAADAGRELMQSVNLGHLDSPSKPPFWFNVAEGRHAQTEFSAFRLGALVDASFSPAMVEVELLETLASTLRTFERDAEPSAEPEPGRGLLHRHVFYEAVSEWLGQQIKTPLAPIRLPHASLITDRGEEFVVVFDGARWEFGKSEVEWALDFARVARSAVEALAGRTTGRKGSKRPRRKPKPTTRPLTEKQVEAYHAVQEHGTVARAALHLGRDRSTVDQHYKAALNKLGRSALKQRTVRLPTDRRGQVAVSEDEPSGG